MVPVMHHQVKDLRIPMTFFIEVDQTFLKFIWNNKCPQIAKATIWG